MFWLSLSSKELFHSNFLAWIGTLPGDRGKNHPFRRLMCDLGAKNENWGDDWFVAREYMNFDLCVLSSAPDESQDSEDGNGGSGAKRNKERSPKILLVLENKLKSIPYIEQLDKYCNKVKDRHNVDFLLLSMADEFPDKEAVKEQGIWKIVSYKTYLKSLSDIPFEGYEKQIVTDYCSQLGCIQTLCERWTGDLLESQFLYFQNGNGGRILQEEYLQLKQLRIHDLYHKYRHAHISSELKNQLSSALQAAGYDNYGFIQVADYKKTRLKRININLGFGFLHGEPVLDLYLIVDKLNLYVIQVQADHYVHGWVRLDSKYKGRPEDLWEHVSVKDDWWLQSPQSPILKDRNNRTKPFGKYDSANSMFVYKYWLIDATAKVKDLLACMVQDFICLCERVYPLEPKRQAIFPESPNELM